MVEIHFSIDINAPKEKVYNAMLKEYPYRAWTQVFGPGSHYVGDWGEGSKILFLAPDENGKMSGMIARIKENRPYEYVSIEYLGIVEDGKEDTTSDEARRWPKGLKVTLIKIRMVKPNSWWILMSRKRKNMSRCSRNYGHRPWKGLKELLKNAIKIGGGF